MKTAVKKWTRRNWHYLKVGEVIQKGDEYRPPTKRWVPTKIYGDVVDENMAGNYRREIKE